MGDREDLADLRRMAELEAKAGNTTASASEPVSAVPESHSGMGYDSVRRVMEMAGKMSGLGESPTYKAATHIVPNLLPGAGAATLLNKASEASYDLGGKVTDVTGSPALGYLANVASQAPAVAVGGGLGSKAAPLLEGAATGLMRSAVKPTLADSLSGKADRAVKTLFEKGLNPTMSGMAELRSEGTALNDQVYSLLQQSGKTISKGAVGSTVQDVVNRIEKTSSFPQDPLAAVERVYTQFMRNGLVPQNIPVVKAQELKQGIYQELKKKYGVLGTDTEEAMKAIGRGYRQELEKAVPEVIPVNAKASDIWNALNVTERRAYLDLNKDPAGLALLTHSGPAFAAYMANKSGLFKALVARALNANKGTIPTAMGASAGAASDYLSIPQQ